MDDAAWWAAQRAFSEIRLTRSAFEAHVNALGWTDEQPPRLAELYLCAACAAHERAAWRRFDADYTPYIARGARRVLGDPVAVDEAVQEVRRKLALGPRPKIATYTGQGGLGSWLAIVGARATLDGLRRTQRSAREECALRESTPLADSAPEGKLDRARWQPCLEQGLARALAQLTPRERNVLRMHYGHALSIDAIGRVYGVHRATVARWLSAARERLRTGVTDEPSHALTRLSRSELCGIAQAAVGHLGPRVTLDSHDA